MLINLGVRNLAVIELIDLEFGEGLTVLTGETGAGKSILLDALGLATGRRADVSMIRPGADRASVTARFAVPADHAAACLLDGKGIETDGEIIVRRQIRADGRSQAFVNDNPVGVALLAELGEFLVEVHGQHDQRGLLRAETHRAMLDAFGNHGDACEKTRRSYRAWREAADLVERLGAEESGMHERRDMLMRDIEELAQLDPAPDEEAELAALRTRLANGQKIAEALSAALDDLEADRGVDSRLRRAIADLERLRDVSGGMLDDILAALERALVEAGEASACLNRAGNELESDGERLEQVEGRLFALRAVARRHMTAVDELPEVRARLEAELAGLENHGESLEQARTAARHARKAFDGNCDSLSKCRTAAGRDLDKAVSEELEPLRMGGARFETALEPLAPDARTGEGAETVQFRVVTTPGADPGPLGRIASGGELSRFMLALKVAGRAGNMVDTLVFDEIDAGIGGAVSDAVGERLWRLGRQAQVMVVTHAPQVAARADHHVRLRRLDSDSAAVSSAVLLDREARREELARMLAGAEITAAARAAAESLLEAGAA